MDSSRGVPDGRSRWANRPADYLRRGEAAATSARTLALRANVQRGIADQVGAHVDAYGWTRRTREVALDTYVDQLDYERDLASLNADLMYLHLDGRNADPRTRGALAGVEATITTHLDAITPQLRRARNRLYDVAEPQERVERRMWRHPPTPPQQHFREPVQEAYDFRPEDFALQAPQQHFSPQDFTQWSLTVVERTYTHESIATTASGDTVHRSTTVVESPQDDLRWLDDPEDMLAEVLEYVGEPVPSPGGMRSETRRSSPLREHRAPLEPLFGGDARSVASPPPPRDDVPARPRRNAEGRPRDRAVTETDEARERRLERRRALRRTAAERVVAPGTLQWANATVAGMDEDARALHRFVTQGRAPLARDEVAPRLRRRTHDPASTSNGTRSRRPGRVTDL